MGASEGRCLKAVGVEENFHLIPRTRMFFSEEGLPATVGVAELSFDEELRSPERDGCHIKFPSRMGKLVYHALRGGTQFLVEVGGQVYFGGTDDDGSVFLTEVTSAARDAFGESGEIGFYNSLKPEELKALEESNSQGVTKRQGDVFAFWCPTFGKSIRGYVSDRLSWKRSSDDKKQTEFTVYDGAEYRFAETRHHVEGRVLVVKEGSDVLTLYTGLLHAPDHKPLPLGDRPHVLFRTANLVRPRSGGCGDR